MDPENYQLTRNDFELCAKNAFKNLLGEEEFSDVTLACSNNKQVKAHKVILGACSPFFREVLLKNPHQHPLIYLKGISIDDLEAIIKFIYQGQTSISETNLDSFLASAQELQVEGLLLAQNESARKHTETQLLEPKKEIPELSDKNEQSDEFDTLADYLKNSQVEPPVNSGEERLKTLPSKFRCDLCDFESLYRKSIKRHKENVHQDKTNVALQSSMDTCAPDGHKDNETVQISISNTDQNRGNVAGFVFENDVYKCDVCDFATKHKWNMKRHVDRVHAPNLTSKNLEEPKIRDDILLKDLLLSDSSVNSDNSLSVASSDPFPRPFYEEKLNVINPMPDPEGVEIHSEVEKHHCDYCDFATTHKKNLRRHVQRLHVNVGTSNNETIGGSAQSNNDLTNDGKPHEDNVSNAQSPPQPIASFTYTCDKCEFTSDNKWNLTRHILRVHKEMKYPCDYCDYKAPQTYRLKEHMQKKHR